MKINNNAKIKIAFDKEEVLRNTGINVIIDLFRFSATIACLLEKKTDIRVFSNPELAIYTFRNLKNSELYSEIDLPVNKFDNSPYIARNYSDSSKTAIVVTNSGSKALMNSISAKEILIGGFHNMPYIIEYLKGKEDILFVPACLFFDRNHIEDFIACEVFYYYLLEGFNREKYMEIHKCGRIIDLMNFKPQTAKDDLKIILDIGGIKNIPSTTICGVYAKIENIMENKK